MVVCAALRRAEGAAPAEGTVPVGGPALVERVEGAEPAEGSAPVEGGSQSGEPPGLGSLGTLLPVPGRGPA